MSRSEKFISEHIKTCSNVIIDCQVVYNGVPQAIYHEWLTPDQARRAVEIAREEMIEKAIKWVEYNNENGGCKFDGWVENIKQSMKDE